jgi:hypothetical protein
MEEKSDGALMWQTVIEMSRSSIEDIKEASEEKRTIGQKKFEAKKSTESSSEKPEMEISASSPSEDIKAALNLASEDVTPNQEYPDQWIRSESSVSQTEREIDLQPMDKVSEEQVTKEDTSSEGTGDVAGREYLSPMTLEQAMENNRNVYTYLVNSPDSDGSDYQSSDSNSSSSSENSIRNLK